MQIGDMCGKAYREHLKTRVNMFFKKNYFFLFLLKNNFNVLDCFDALISKIIFLK